MNRTELIYGQHAVRAALKARPEAAQELWLQNPQQADPQVMKQVAQLGLPVQRVSAATLSQHTEDASHQGIALRIRSRAALTEQDLPDLLNTHGDSCRLLVLDGVTDPHNLGACLRVAEAAGVQAVITPTRRQAALTPSVYKTASGSAERIPLLQVSNLARTLEILKKSGLWLYAACGDASNDLWDNRFHQPWAMVLGGEGEGLRSRTQKLCDFRLRIPLHGPVESLNVATAASVFLFEAQRQRNET